MEIATSILLAIILASLTYVLYTRLFESLNYWKSRGIPCVPGALPIFGNALPVFQMRYNFAVLCQNIYESHLDKSMIGFYNMNRPTLLIRDLDLIKTVLQTNFNNFQHNDLSFDLEIDSLIGGDIGFIRGREWKNGRAIVVSAFSTKRLKNMCLMIEKVCEKLDNYLKEQIGDKDSMELEAKFLFSRYTTEVAASTVFGIEGHSFANDYAGTLLDAMKTLMDPSFKKAIKNFVLLNIPSLHRLMKNPFVSPKIDKFFRKVVKDVEELRERDKESGNDVLQMTIDLQRENKISHDFALSTIFSFFLDSYESSSLTMSFAIYELAKYQAIQERLRQEIVTILGKYENRLTYEAILEMNYLGQVISETMRIFPTVGFMGKVCSEACRLEGPDRLVVDVEPDVKVVIPVQGLHRDPEIWENPETFDPERFRKGNYEGRHKFAYLPFGEGPRACPGSRLAIMQIKAAIATILKNYRVSLSTKMIEPLRIDPRYFLTTAEGGFWIQFETLNNH